MLTMIFLYGIKLVITHGIFIGFKSILDYYSYIPDCWQKKVCMGRKTNTTHPLILSKPIINIILHHPKFCKLEDNNPRLKSLKRSKLMASVMKIIN